MENKYHIVTKTLRKGEITYYKQFLLFSVFSTAIYCVVMG